MTHKSFLDIPKILKIDSPGDQVSTSYYEEPTTIRGPFSFTVEVSPRTDILNDPENGQSEGFLARVCQISPGTTVRVIPAGVWCAYCIANFR